MSRAPRSAGAAARRAASVVPAGIDPAAISRPLRRWFRTARRDLPWRRTRDPYAIWVSEVMLQQTRVATVIPYYERFLARFPDPQALAGASEEELLRHWAGLGYYSRGRNLQEAARTIVAEHAGRLPDSAAGLRALPGIGEYTAAAVGSIAFGDEVAVVDGNVERVLARVFAVPGDPRGGSTRRRLRELAAAALPAGWPGQHNEALMELGALVCTPRSPACERCPLADSCAARARGEVARFPELPARRHPVDQHWVAAIPLAPDGSTWVIETPADAELLPGHRGYPLASLEPGAATDPEAVLAVALRLLRAHYGSRVRKGAVLAPVRHTITHRRLHLHPVCFPAPRPTRGKPLPAGRTGELPALFRKLGRAASEFLD